MKGSALSLAQRKQALIAQNASLRREISRNLDEIESGARQLFGWVETGQKITKGGFWLAGLSGLIFGWRLLRGHKSTPSPSSARGSLLGSLLQGGLRATGLVGTAIKLWRNWSAMRPSKEEERGEAHSGVTPRFKT